MFVPAKSFQSSLMYRSSLLGPFVSSVENEVMLYTVYEL
jgi:hypothetical protein